MRFIGSSAGDTAIALFEAVILSNPPGLDQRRPAGVGVGFRKRKRRLEPAFSINPTKRLRLALASLETRVGLADHEDLATTAHDLAVAVTGLGRLQGVEDFHGNSWERTNKEAEV
jgi:hypothetical protein